MRLLFVQYAGDYRETVQRFASGGGETYYAQKYSVDAVADIARKVESVTVLCCMTNEVYSEILENGVHAVGAGLNEKHFSAQTILQLVEAQNPTHLIMRTPIRAVISWAIQKKIPTLGTFAESVSGKGLRSKLRHYLLSRLLNHHQVEWVGCYGIPSSLSFQEAGIKAEKIIPWDFLAAETPEQWLPKTLQKTGNDWQLLYIGSLIEGKGVGDALKAIAILKSQQFPIHLRVVGNDIKGSFQAQAKQLQIEDCVEFLGVISNETVVPLMREANAVLVPSRHEYPEGFPLAITHALCARTPVIASDHPMFIKKLKHLINAMIFPAKNSNALAACITQLLSNPDLYSRLSANSHDTWEQMQIPVKWAELINRWLNPSAENQQWLFNHRLSSGLYDSQLT